MKVILLVLLTSVNSARGACLDHFNSGSPPGITSLSGYGSWVNSYTCLRWDWNSISVIPQGLLHGTITTSLNFDRNVLTTQGIPHDAFNRMTSLETLQLQHMYLTVVKATWFHNLTSLHTLWLSFNNIHTIEVSAFKDLVSINTLGLNDNDLKEIQFNVFNPDNLPNNIGSLYLSTNPWNCTCLMCWAKLGQGTWITLKESSGTTSCSTPAALANQLYLNVSR